MDELLEQIRAFPILALSPDEWNSLLKITSALDILSGKAFSDAIENPEVKHKFSKAKIDTIIKYLDHWQTVASSMNHYMDFITTAYHEKIGKEMGADELLPCIILLLSASPSLIKTVWNKLKIAQIFEQRGQVGYIAATFISACEANQNANLIDELKKDASLVNIIDEFKKKEIIISITKMCLALKQALSHKLHEKIKMENKLAYQSYFEDNSGNDDDVIISTINHDVQNRLPPFIDNEELVNLVTQFCAIFDIYHTLIKKNTPSNHLLREFFMKFSLYSSILENTNDHIASKKFKKLGSYIIKIPKLLRVNRLSSYFWQNKKPGTLNEVIEYLSANFSLDEEDTNPVTIKAMPKSH